MLFADKASYLDWLSWYEVNSVGYELFLLLLQFLNNLFGQDGYSGFKKLCGSHVNRLSSRFNAENRRNAFMGLILIFKTPGLREMIV
jgi:hypothetical protein